ncbi:uncharacterized protein LOC128092322 [Culex pipiens pallens]|uniref:uncharacterized protein LOC128092322 n=1 Tax=Culex pipiens pallens TaxID=42434 RepID=UPI0022AB03D9|nr:uncharacterized protein LOC128092322 [Culex pipiens pallens]
MLLGYVDDIDIIGIDRRSVEEAFVPFKREAAKIGLTINTAKTKYLVAGRARGSAGDGVSEVEIDGERYEVVDEFVYLGTLVTCDNDIRAAELAAVLAAPQLLSASAAELAASAATHNASAQLVPAPTTHANSVVAQQAAAQAAKTACAHALKQATALAVQQISQNLANAAKVRAAAQAAERAANEVASTAQKRDTNTSNKPMYTTPTKCKI